MEVCMQRQIYRLEGQVVTHPLTPYLQEGFVAGKVREIHGSALTIQELAGPGNELVEVARFSESRLPTRGMLIHGLTIVPELYLLRELASSPNERVIGLEKYDIDRRVNFISLRRLLGYHAFTFVRQVANEW